MHPNLSLALGLLLWPATKPEHTPPSQWRNVHEKASEVLEALPAHMLNSRDKLRFIIAASKAEMARQNSHAELVAALDWMDATAVNLHCALQSTACMDPNDKRIAVITGEVVRDLLVMRDKARAALAKAQA